MLDAKSRSTGLIGVKAATSFGCSLARYMQSHTVNTIQYMVPKFNAVIIALLFSPNCNELFRTVGLKNDPVEIHCRVNSCDCAITYLYYFIFCWVKEKGKPPNPPSEVGAVYPAPIRRSFSWAYISHMYVKLLHDTVYTCHPDFDECMADVCKNGATCSNSVGSYSCACAAGFTDRNCTTGKS